MGQTKSRINEMPHDLKEKCLELFRKIDTDGSKTIDKAETMKFWGKKFAKLNSDELFHSVDKNNDGSIQEEEWLEFWHNVYCSGQPKEDIIFELNNILEGGAWVKYENVSNLNQNYKKKPTKGKD